MMTFAEAQEFFIKAVENRDYLNEQGKQKMIEAEDIIAKYFKEEAVCKEE